MVAGTLPGNRRGIGARRLGTNETFLSFKHIHRHHVLMHFRPILSCVQRDEA